MPQEVVEMIQMIANIDFISKKLSLQPKISKEKASESEALEA